MNSEQPLIEGKNFDHDISVQWVDLCDEIRDIEKGTPILEFEKELTTRNLGMEFRVKK
jgi:hypothetical protein